MKRFIIISIVLLMLVGCAPKGEDNPDITIDEPVNTSSVTTSNTQTDPPSTEPDRLPDEVEKLQKMLSDAELLTEVTKESAGEYSFDDYEHAPEECYIFELNNGESVYLRRYDSDETAADEASNYGGDGSEYSDGNDHSMIIDYIAPVHFWLSGDSIIEFASSENDVALILKEFYGEQFAGSEINDDAQVRFTVEYADASVGETDLSDAMPIRTRGELEEYYRIISESYYWSPYTEPYTDDFKAVMEHYTDEWFEENSLIIVYAISSTGPANFVVNGVISDDNEYKVILSCEAGEDEEIVEKYIFVGPEGVKLKPNSTITLINAYDRPVTENSDQRAELTLEKLIELDKSGRELSWSDFENYRYDEVGSGLYIRRYFLHDRGYLMMIGGGSLEEKPMYITLYRMYEDSEETCEVGEGKVEEFVERCGVVE